MNKKMKISFLLGSGISQPILNANIDTITSSLINDFWEERGKLFYKKDTQGQESEIVQSYKSFIRFVIEELRIVNGNKKEKGINYEQVYYVCDQIRNLRENSLTNPLAIKHILQLQKKCSHLIVNEFGDKRDFTDYARDVSRFIDSVVFNHLVYTGGLDYFIPVFENFKSKGISSDIFSLNHDLLLEKYFQKKGIIFNDFFKDGNSPLRKFSIESVDEKEGYDFCLYKLHGSINWIRTSRNFFDYYIIDDFSDNLLKNFPALSKSIGKPTIKWTPEFLTGHINKSVDYFHGIYSFLISKFIERINKAEVLIVSGFGWKDYVIRQIIYEWLTYKSSRKLILCYENDSDPRSFFGVRMESPQIINTGKWLSEISFDSIKKHLP